jgi:hypothetical protein
VGIQAIRSKKIASEKILTIRFTSQLTRHVLSRSGTKENKNDSGNDDGRTENPDASDYHALVGPQRPRRNVRNQDFLGF